MHVTKYILNPAKPWVIIQTQKIHSFKVVVKFCMFKFEFQLLLNIQSTSNDFAVWKI